MNPGALPVQIVDLELDKFHLGVLGEDFIQQIGGVVEGEAGAADEALGLFLCQELKAVEALKFLIVGPVNAVEEVVVEIACAGLFQLLGEHLVPARLVVKEAGVQLIGQGEALPGVALHQGGFGGVFTLEAAVHPGSVKIGEAPLKKGVYHLLDLLQVDVGGIVPVA